MRRSKAENPVDALARPRDTSYEIGSSPHIRWELPGYPVGEIEAEGVARHFVGQRIAPDSVPATYDTGWTVMLAARDNDRPDQQFPPVATVGLSRSDSRRSIP